MSSEAAEQQYHFVYKGVEYDASGYATKHPGGVAFLENMKNVRKDITEYFRSLHSDAAEKVFKSFPILSVGQPTQHSDEYLKLYHKLQSFNSPIWSVEVLLFILNLSMWLVACITPYAVLSVTCFALTQVIIGWVAHSCAHNRNPALIKFGTCEAGLLGGFSISWWSPKHNMHHMFSNVEKYDQDIQHSYKVYMYPFLYLKWRYDSLMASIIARNGMELTMISLNYLSLWLLQANIANFLIGELIAGFYSAFVLIGNHEREQRYEEKPDVPFMDHQIRTCRNYREQNFFWLLLMGGMQYQTEHHLFPQIPFYRLPHAKPLIHAHLEKAGKSMIYGPVI